MEPNPLSTTFLGIAPDFLTCQKLNSNHHLSLLYRQEEKKKKTLKISGKILSLLHAHTELGILGSAWTLLHSLGIREQIPQRAAPLLDPFGENHHTLACYLLLVMKRSFNKHQSNIVSLVSSGYVEKYSKRPTTYWMFWLAHDLHVITSD